MSRAVRYAALLALLAAPAAHAGEGDAWYAGLATGIVVTDQRYHHDGDLHRATIGRTFGPEYAVELELAVDELDFGIDYGLRHRSVGLVHRTINREPLWDPYFLMGVGLIEFDAPPGSEVESGHDVMFNLGIGGEWELLTPNRLFLRADLRLRYDLNDTDQPGQNGFGDGVFTLGLVYPFGASR